VVKKLTAIDDRIGRAEEHLEVIQGRLLDYYRADKCVVTGEYKPEADGLYGTVEDGVVDTPPIDPRLNTITGEFLHDLRSSLDHLAWQLVLHAQGKPTRKTSFPIRAVPSANEKGEWVGPDVAGGISNDAEALIGAAQPYQRGSACSEHPLWLLHQLWNIDKHRYVIAQGSHTAITFPVWLPRFRFSTRLESATKDGARLRVIPDDPAVNVEAYTTVQVAIHEPEYGIERPLLRTLEETQQAVRNLVEDAEARCF